LFQVLIEKFDQKSNFKPDWPELGLIIAELGLNVEKNIVFKCCEWYYIVSLFNDNHLFVVLIWKFAQKSNFQPSLD